MVRIATWEGDMWIHVQKRTIWSADIGQTVIAYPAAGGVWVEHVATDDDVGCDRYVLVPRKEKVADETSGSDDGTVRRTWRRLWRRRR